MRLTVLQLCVQQGIRRMSCPEPERIKVAKNNNMFCCSSVLGQARYAANSSTNAEAYNRRAKLYVVRLCFIVYQNHFATL